MNRITNQSLAKVVVFGAFGLCSTGMFLQWKVKDKLRQNEFYQEALKILRSNSGAKNLLGEPIKDGNFSLDSKINSCTESKATFQIPVKGSKDKGTLFFWAERPNLEDKWNVYRMELELQKDVTKRLMIRDNEPILK